MSLSDIFSFEKFNLKDMASKLRKQPWRLVTGVDPASTTAWNKVLGQKGEPVVDQMGGPYGGQVISMSGSGGVYDRARKAGIDTTAGLRGHQLAHVIAAAIAGGSAMGAGGGGSPAPGGGGTPAPQGGTPAQPTWMDYYNQYSSMPRPGQQQNQSTPQQEDPFLERYRQRRLAQGLRSYA